MRLSNNFIRAEFKCKCGKCDSDSADAELVTVLQDVRTYFNRKVTITSAHRCESYNRRVGGSPNSKHLLGQAADIQVNGVSAREVQQYLKIKYPDKYGIGSYSTFTHIDVRKQRARWSG